jgi:CarboxypepD_reg-like domain
MKKHNRLMKIALAVLMICVFGINAKAQSNATISGIVKDAKNKTVLPFVNVVLKKEKDSSFVSGTITNEEGRFTIANIKTGEYFLEVSGVGLATKNLPVFIGNLTTFLDVKTVEVEAKATSLTEVVVTAKQNEISEKMDKKTFSLKDNISQSGGSLRHE